MTYPPQSDGAPVQKKSRPRSVIFAATLQLMAAATFVISEIVLFVYGADAQAAAEAEVVKQGFPAGVLVEHNVRFGDKGAVEIAPGIAIALGLTTLALLNLAGNRVGRILSWIFQPILIVAGSIIIPGQVFTVQFVESVFKNSGDAMLERVNVQATVDAAAHAYPAWFPYVVGAKFVLATLGSLFVIILLALPSAKGYFRSARPAAERTV